MSMPTIIRVTRDHIARGRQYVDTHCPIALAIRDVFPGEAVSVGVRVIVGERVFLLDTDVSSRIRQYDHFGKMKPHRLLLDEEHLTVTVIEKTVVIFRKDRFGVFALFPEIPANLLGNDCLMYQHIGQHGVGDPGYIMRRTKPANDEESLDLINELDAIGYDLEIRRRISPQMHEKRRREATRARARGDQSATRLIHSLDEVVIHYIDGNPLNSSPDNLRLLPLRKHRSR